MTAAPYLVLRRRRISGSGAFDPASLFAGGENGVWYEPSTTTAFRSTTDLTPCAVGQSCGLLLDKSQGAGYSGGAFTGLESSILPSDASTDDSNTVAEWERRVTSGTEDDPTITTQITVAVDDTDPDTGTRCTLISIDGSVAACAFLDLNDFGFSTTGKAWLVEARVKVAGPGTSSRLAFQYDLNNAWEYNPDGYIGQIQSYTGNGQYNTVSAIIPAGAAARYLSLRFHNPTGAMSVRIDGLKVRELPGFHATQGTAAARPILRQTAGGLYYLEFDAVDDRLAIPSLNLRNATWDALAAYVPANEDFMLIHNGAVANTPWVVIGEELSGSSDFDSIGTPTPSVNSMYLDNVLQTPADRDEFFNAAQLATRMHGNFSVPNTGDWSPSIGLAGNTAFQMPGPIYAYFIREGSMDETQRSDLDTYLAGRVPA